MGRPRKDPGERTVPVSVSVPDDVLYALELEAALGRRSVSSTAVLYMTSNVALSPVRRPGHGVTGEQAKVAARDSPGVPGASGPHKPKVDTSKPIKATPAKARPNRTGLCEHRVPADSYCRKCDR